MVFHIPAAEPVPLIPPAAFAATATPTSIPELAGYALQVSGVRFQVSGAKEGKMMTFYY
jgi:hypothetical protein